MRLSVFVISCLAASSKAYYEVPHDLEDGLHTIELNFSIGINNSNSNSDSNSNDNVSNSPESSKALRRRSMGNPWPFNKKGPWPLDRINPWPFKALPSPFKPWVGPHRGPHTPYSDPADLPEAEEHKHDVPLAPQNPGPPVEMSADDNSEDPLQELVPLPVSKHECQFDVWPLAKVDYDQARRSLFSYCSRFTVARKRRQLMIAKSGKAIVYVCNYLKKPQVCSRRELEFVEQHWLDLRCGELRPGWAYAEAIGKRYGRARPGQRICQDHPLKDSTYRGVPRDGDNFAEIAQQEDIDADELVYFDNE